MKIDPEAMKNISSNDKKRITRILEIYKATGKNKTEQEKASHKLDVKYDFRKFVISWDREKLYERINLRVDLMIKDGLIDEVKNLLDKYKEYPTAMQALGYKEVVEYFDGKLSYEEMIDKIKMETRHYAKRQLTWFRKNNDYIWLDGAKGNEENIKIILEDWRKQLKRKIKSFIKLFGIIALIVFLIYFLLNTTNLINRSTGTFMIENGSLSFEEETERLYNS